MKQVVFIHGGETFDTYESYVEALRTWKYDPSWEIQRRWKHTLRERLGDDWQVFTPTMPSKYNAKYLEWLIWFEKILPHLKEGVILIGHSLGGIFLAKYMNENELPVQVHATFLVAAPFDATDTDFSLADFTLSGSLANLESRAGTLYLYHSEDDDVVPFSALEKYKEHLPKALVRVLTDRGHVLQEEFPELIEDVRGLK